MPFNAQTRGGFDAFFAATLHTDDNNVILSENVLLLITFLVPKLDDNEIMLLTRGVPDALSSNGNFLIIIYYVFLFYYNLILVVSRTKQLLNNRILIHVDVDVDVDVMAYLP